MIIKNITIIDSDIFLLYTLTIKIFDYQKSEEKRNGV